MTCKNKKKKPSGQNQGDTAVGLLDDSTLGEITQCRLLSLKKRTLWVHFKKSNSSAGRRGRRERSRSLPPAALRQPRSEGRREAPPHRLPALFSLPTRRPGRRPRGAQDPLPPPPLGGNNRSCASLLLGQQPGRRKKRAGPRLAQPSPPDHLDGRGGAGRLGRTRRGAAGDGDERCEKTLRGAPLGAPSGRSWNQDDHSCPNVRLFPALEECDHKVSRANPLSKFWSNSSSYCCGRCSNIYNSSAHP